MVGFRYTLTTDYALEYIENKIKKIVADELNRKIEIESISGDAWKRLILEQVKFSKSENVQQNL